MIILTIEAVALVLVSLISDIKTGKIKNIVTIPFIAAGMLTNLYIGGITGLLQSAAGFMVPVAVLFVLFALKMLGAGDIKAFGAIGAIMGYEFALFNIICSFLTGGLICIILLKIRKNGRQRFKYLFIYLRSCYLSRRLSDYNNSAMNKNANTFPFTYAMAAGTILQLLICWHKGVFLPTGGLFL